MFKYIDVYRLYNTNKNIEAILFDMDGVVLRSENLFSLAEKKVLKYYGLRVSNESLSEFKGMSENDFYKNFIKKFNLNDSIENIQRRLKSYLFNLFKTEISYMDGFESFYRNNIKGTNIKTAIVTNTSNDIIHKIKECINIDHYFNLIITSSDVINPKPCSEPYEFAMNKLSVTNINTIIIEDSAIGLQAALKTGARVFGLTSTITKKEMQKISSNIEIFDGFDEITNFLFRK